jgi:hypothetical protein
VEEVGALLVEGSEVGTNSAESLKASLDSEAAGDFLFDLGHADGLLGGIVGEATVF